MADIGFVPRLLSGLYSVPLWILVAFAAVGYAALFAPAFGDVDLTEFRRQWGALFWLDAIGFTILSAACVVDLTVKAGAARARRARRRDRNAYERAYAPIQADLMKIHISTSSATLAPSLEHRIKNAWNAFSSIKRRRYALRAAWKALFDRRIIQETGEVDHGGSFPIEKIERVVQSNRLYCDDKLLQLLNRALGKRWDEQVGSSELTHDDVRLYDHIVAECDRLKNRLRR